MNQPDPSQSLFLQPRLSKNEWERAITALPRIGETMVSATKHVLVDGETPSDVSKDYDVSRQAISAGVQRVIDKHLQLSGKVLSDDPHTLISFSVPQEYRMEVRQLINEFLAGIRFPPAPGRRKRRASVRWRSPRKDS